MNTRSLFALGLIGWTMACGSTRAPGTGDSPSTRVPDRPLPTGEDIPCREASCGDSRFRSAVPTAALVRIDFGTTRGGTSAIQRSGDIGGAGWALDEVSDAYLLAGEHVAEINDVVDEVFAELEWVAGSEPETADEAEHLWRAETGGEEAVLDIETEDETTFNLAYYEGPAGFDPALAEPIVYGTVQLGADDEVAAFALTLDLDADPSLAATGEIDLAALPFGGGTLEVQYDFIDVSFAGEAPENSITTYWIFVPGSYGLEYLADVEGEQATVYVRWDELGGRWDHHLAYDDFELGPVDEFATNCWTVGGAEVFDAWAVTDGYDFYGELDGVEGDCDFGPVADHPEPGTDFDLLPAEGEWDAIDFATATGDLCDPDFDPECCDPEFDPFC